MPTVKAGNRMCQPITQANCRRDNRTGSRSMVDPLLPSATRRTNAPHPCAQGYTDAAVKARPRMIASQNRFAFGIKREKCAGRNGRDKDIETYCRPPLKPPATAQASGKPAPEALPDLTLVV